MLAYQIIKPLMDFLHFTERVTYLGFSFALNCSESGLFEVPEKEPFCRAPIPCPGAPVPPNSTLLEESHSTDVKEWDKAFYECQPGSKIPDNFVENVQDGNFTVQCGSAGVYPVMKQFFHD